MRMSTVFLCYALMGSFVKFSLGYLPIRLTTLRSKLATLHSFASFFTLAPTHRVLIATIRDMGGCPCPRCTIKKECLYALGTTGDTADRILKVRRDDVNFRSIVQEARDNIYRKGYALQSEPGVERLLKESSLVPTLVSNLISSCVGH